MGWSDEKEPLKWLYLFKVLEGAIPDQDFTLHIMVNCIHTITRVITEFQTIHYGKMTKDK
jgi:hypothetical protein